MAKAIDVANYFLTRAGEEAAPRGRPPHINLQLLVYYAQGFALAILGRPLFDEDFEPWQGGPALPSLRLQQCSSPVPAPGFAPQEKFDTDECSLLEQIFKRYAGCASPRPSKQASAALKGLDGRCETDKEKMAAYFSSAKERKEIERHVLDEEARRLAVGRNYNTMLRKSLGEARSGQLKEYSPIEASW